MSTIVRCLGTEERVTDPKNKVPASHGILAYVTFPGSDIKDLYLHDYDSTATESPAPEPPKKQHAAPQSKPQQTVSPEMMPPAPPTNQPAKAQRQQAQPQNQPKQNQSQKIVPQKQTNGPPAKPAAAPASRHEKGSSGIGTGEHLLHLRVKKTGSDQNQSGDSNAAKGVFDFAAALSAFNKTQVMESVAQDPERGAIVKALYKKDDFFDSLSCDVLDREMGRRTHMTNSEERTLNQDTFGAVALQSSSYSRGRRYNGNSGGRGGYGRGYSGGQGLQQQGRGRGGGRGSGYRGGRGGSRGGRGGGQQNRNATAAA